jgi:hypothetical protein
MKFEDISLFLPKYLSADSERELFAGIKDFPENIDSRLYSCYLANEENIFQGDGINDLLVVNLPQEEIRPTPCMVLSNTCDIDPNNRRLFPSQIVYVPIFNLNKYKAHLLSKSSKSKQQINDHMQSIKRQEITQIFYLPPISDCLEESIVFFDRICNCSSSYINRSKLSKQRIFTLSDYGAYLFLLKISIHFTRIQDSVERKSDTLL